MHINDTVIYFDPLTANQPLDQSNTSASDTTADDTGTQVGTATSTPADATGEVNTVGSILSLVVPLLLMGVVFYFFLIRPQRKKDKAVKNMLDALKPGDRICTIGGIYGTVDRLKDDTVTIIVGSDKSRMVMAKWAIRSVENATVENDSSPEV
ncbi:MAG TPA: preprotein translocase subunit YajC [Candidatus Fimadaptatus faecigallinarum]|uniref:Preprotein translocase subunit YajC n=1 Tax=Candidatus Fimadaptatus faecigallinarum TaxID=2840814 RepID=A0A9D1LRH7_9FIRM|nr:preprotein translocase subunit YajC [Candidatus Fimadaptatus faecigallinarum]